MLRLKTGMHEGSLSLFRYCCHHCEHNLSSPGKWVGWKDRAQGADLIVSPKVLESSQTAAIAAFFCKGNKHVPHWEPLYEVLAPGDSILTGWQAPYHFLKEVQRSQVVGKAMSCILGTAQLQTMKAAKPLPLRPIKKLPPLYPPRHSPCCVYIHGITDLNKLLPKRTTHLVSPLYPTPDIFQKGLV